MKQEDVSWLIISWSVVSSIRKYVVSMNDKTCLLNRIHTLEGKPTLTLNSQIKQVDGKYSRVLPRHSHKHEQAWKIALKASE
jgi:hypothetical protein